MAMTLRLDREAQDALDQITSQEHVSATKAISDALIEYAAKRSHLRDSLIEQIVDERSDLLERLA